ncbi:MAG TPA: hypothetical protein VNK46_11785 [Nitrospiraceae bacterium]|jgi:hypothetical protein|nr:hypothetical protein [Nitrospiraceae bacterium]
MRCQWSQAASRAAAAAMVALILGVVQFSVAEPTPANSVLPRSFQGARLGMALTELVRTDPQIARTAVQANGRQTETVAVASQDPHIHRVTYRFYRGALYEQAISYRPNQLPRGYEGLLDRLKQVYGRPVVENAEEYDLSRDIFSMRRTVWRDDATRIVLAEIRKLTDGREQFELVLTMTDLALEQARDRTVQEQLRRKEQSIPIPLPDPRGTSARTARPPEGEQLDAPS